MTAHPLRHSVIAAMAVLTVASCGGSGGSDAKLCTLVAWYSGVDVKVESSDWQVEEFCLEGTCDDPNSVVTGAPSPDRS